MLNPCRVQDSWPGATIGGDVAPLERGHGRGQPRARRGTQSLEFALWTISLLGASCARAAPCRCGCADTATEGRSIAARPARVRHAVNGSSKRDGATNEAHKVERCMQLARVAGAKTTELLTTTSA